MPILTTHLLQDVIHIAQQAGEHLRRFYQHSVSVQIKSSTGVGRDSCADIGLYLLRHERIWGV